MAKPQQPGLRRSGRVPALDPDASEADLSGRRRPGTSETETPVPEEQRPGHHPENEQDKPDLDAFADRLGIVPEGEEPEPGPTPEELVEQNPVARSIRRSVAFVLIGPMVGVGAARAVFRILRRRRG